MKPTDILQQAEIEQAVALLRAGELVAFPTETVYGLGADAANPIALAKIFAAKARPADHPLIVHLAEIEDMRQWGLDLPPSAWDLAAAFWPGPLTLIVQRAAGVPDALTGGQNTVGLRVPAHPLALSLLQAYQAACRATKSQVLCGIAAPSANRFGRISPTTAAHVRSELGDAVHLILDGGACQVGIESTIIDLSQPEYAPRLLRPGNLSPEQIARVIGVQPIFPISFDQQHNAATEHANQQATPRVNQRETPRVSGSLDAHYAPQTALEVLSCAVLEPAMLNLEQSAASYALLAYSDAAGEIAQRALTRENGLDAHSFIKLPAHPAGYAQGLYAALRQLDTLNKSRILLEATPTTTDWLAINDRLRRAVCGAGQGAV